MLPIKFIGQGETYIFLESIQVLYLLPLYWVKDSVFHMAYGLVISKEISQ